MRKPISVSLDEDVIDAVDLLREDISRSRYMERLLIRALRVGTKKEVEVFGYA